MTATTAEVRAASADTHQYTVDTEAFAALNGVKPQSVRARICNFGHYFGIKPIKLANGRLLFPAVQAVSQ